MARCRYSVSVASRLTAALGAARRACVACAGVAGHPGSYLHKRGNELRVRGEAATAEHAASATFHLVPGLADPAGAHHPATGLVKDGVGARGGGGGGRVMDGTDPAQCDRVRCMALMVLLAVRCAEISLTPAGHPGKYVRHAEFKMRVDSNDDSALFKMDATFHLCSPKDAMT
jgi:hypothetical protein